MNEHKHTPKPACDEVAKKAYSLCEKEGRPQGHDKQNWVAVETETSIQTVTTTTKNEATP